MPRQNRLTPFGKLISTPARGKFMGNRGVLHNSQGELTDRRWQGKAWITCVLESNGEKRELMRPGHYTELFFLDEVTALAAGHRPCSQCRHSDFKRFKEAWAEGNANVGLGEKPSIGKIDGILHDERLNAARSKVVFEDRLQNLPDGVIVTGIDTPTDCFLLLNRELYLWSPSGYSHAQEASPESRVSVLTPHSTVNAIRAGYTPHVLLSGG